jgi:Domain of unknown function (DUF4209)
MSLIKDKLTAILDSFEKENESFDEFDVYSELNLLASEGLEGSEHEKLLLLAETMAFGFVEDYSDDKTGWNTYFGPMIVSSDGHGNWYESPSIKLITSEVLEYWLKRAEQATNSVFVQRYANLVWEFSRKILGVGADINAAYLAIDNSLRIVENEMFKHEIDAIKKMERGLAIALSISDTCRIEQVISMFLEFEERFGQDKNIGVWGRCFDALMVNKKIPLTVKQRETLIQNMETRLRRFENTPEFPLSVNASEHAALRLIQYYKKHEQYDDVKRVLRGYGKLIVSSAEKFDPIAGLNWLEKLFDLYIANGMQKDADNLSILLHDFGKRTSENMKEFSFEMKISNEEMEQIFSEILTGDKNEALGKIAINFIPNHNKIIERVRESAKEAPLLNIIGNSILDEDGRTVSRVGSIEEDLEGRVVVRKTQEMQIQSPILNLMLKRLFETYDLTIDGLLDYLYLSPFFFIENRNMLLIGLKAYVEENLLVAAHILIPQIENILRNALKILGGALYKPGRHGGYYLKTLDELLCEDKLREVLGVSIVEYFRILLTDQRGWNLRNRICHGIAKEADFGSIMTDYIFHVFLVLAIFRMNEK